MRAAEYAVATRMEEILRDKPKIANPLFPGSYDIKIKHCIYNMLLRNIKIYRNTDIIV